MTSSFLRVEPQLGRRTCGHDRLVRHDRLQPVLAGAERRPRVGVALVRPERHRPLRQRGDHQRRVHARVGRHDAAVHDVQPRLPEDALVGIDDALVGASRRSACRR